MTYWYRYLLIIDLVGAYFSPGDVARVNGQLAVSRAFGDKNLKSHLRSDPDMKTVDIDSDTELLILASDGLWKVIYVSLCEDQQCLIYSLFCSPFFMQI